MWWYFLTGCRLAPRRTYAALCSVVIDVVLGMGLLLGRHMGRGRLVGGRHFGQPYIITPARHYQELLFCSSHKDHRKSCSKSHLQCEHWWLFSGQPWSRNFCYKTVLAWILTQAQIDSVTVALAFHATGWTYWGSYLFSVKSCEKL